MIGIDCNMLSLVLHPDAKPPRHPETHKPVNRMPERVQKLLDDLDTDGEQIVIPTPALSEFLILADREGADYLAAISGMKTFQIQPFDQRAAIELAAIELADRKAGSKRGGVDAPWQKVKIDRQIVAISKVHNATRILSDDPDIRKHAEKVGIATTSSWELALPPSKEPLFEGLEESEE